MSFRGSWGEAEPIPWLFPERSDLTLGPSGPHIPLRQGFISLPPQIRSQLRLHLSSVLPHTPMNSPSHLEQEQVHPQTPAAQTDPPLEENVSGNTYGKQPAAADSGTAISHLSLQKPQHTHIREGQRGWGPVSKVNRIKRVSCPQCWWSGFLKHTTHTPSGCKLLWVRVRQICIAVRLLTLRQLPPHWLSWL